MQAGTARHIVLCLLLLAAYTGRGQYNSSFLNYGSTGRCVSVSMEADAGSDGLSNRFADKLALGGYIDDGLKSSSAKKLRSRNNFGANLNYGVSAFVKATNSIDLLVGLRDQVIVNGSYSKDVFNLAFYGNQMYEGKTANIGNTSINGLHFQEIKLGAIFHVTDSATKFGIALSFLKGQQMLTASTGSTGSLYTSADGSQILFNPAFSMMYSQGGQNGFNTVNGLGASGELYYETSYEGKIGRKSVFMASLNNFGSILWNNGTQHYASDSSFHYNGYSITSINQLKDSTLKRLNKDSLLHRISTQKKGSTWQNLPASLLLLNKVYFSKDFVLGVGFRYLFNANYRPYVFVEPEYRAKIFTFGVHVGYGGYARLNVGASVTVNTRGWFLKLGSNSLQGFILPNSAFSQGVFLSLAKKLK